MSKPTRQDLADVRDDVEPTSPHERWSPVIDAVSVRLDRLDVEMVVLWDCIDGPHRTEMWDIHCLAKHLESYKYDDGFDTDPDEVNPSAVYVREWGMLAEARITYGRMANDVTEVRIVVDGEIVAAARY